MIRFLIPLLTLALLAPVQAGSKRPDKNKLTFHLEGNRIDGPKMVFPIPVGGEQKFFRKSPITFTRELGSYKPFIADNGTAGGVFFFRKAARTRIAAATTQHQGKWLVAMLNGRPVDMVMIDSPVVDGKLVIWQGITENEIYAFDLELPHTGEDKAAWKDRLKSYKKARRRAGKE